MHVRHLLIPALLLLARGVAAEEPFDLATFLKKTGAIEVERANTTCRWNETTRLEELDGNGKVKGTVTRVFSVTSRGPVPITRTKISESVEGDISSLMREERPQQKGNVRDRLSPFHPEATALYDLSLVSHDEKAVVVAFAPKEAADRRMIGTARIDPETGRVMSLSVKPSKLMAMLDRLNMTLQFAQGPCGNQPRSIESEGSGGFLFFKVRFHSRTELTGHERVEAPAP